MALPKVACLLDAALADLNPGPFAPRLLAGIGWAVQPDRGQLLLQLTHPPLQVVGVRRRGDGARSAAPVAPWISRVGIGAAAAERLVEGLGRNGVPEAELVPLGTAGNMGTCGILNEA